MITVEQLGIIVILVSGLTFWFITLTNNHYQRGYRDGYTRGKAIASERYFD